MTRHDEMRDLTAQAQELVSEWTRQIYGNLEEKLRTAYAQGEKAGLERAAKEFNDDYAYVNVAKTIRALKPEAEERSDCDRREQEGKAEPLYTGQCAHNIPYGQSCVSCRRS